MTNLSVNLRYLPSDTHKLQQNFVCMYHFFFTKNGGGYMHITSRFIQSRFVELKC